MKPDLPIPPVLSAPEQGSRCPGLTASGAHGIQSSQCPGLTPSRAYSLWGSHCLGLTASAPCSQAFGLGLKFHTGCPGLWRARGRS